MRICAAEVAATPLDFLDIFRPFHSKEGIDYLFETDQHYRLLSYLSRQFLATTLAFRTRSAWDVGTAFGASAVALAQNTTMYVVSFDPIPQVHEPIKERYKGIISWSNRDLLAVPKFQMPVAFPDLIVLDVDPHDGVWEKRFLRWLRKLDFTGWLVMDDILPTHHPEMWKVWESIPERKWDLTHMGHFSGTGLVCFNDEPVEVC